MYHYDDFDAAFVAARVEQFRDQVARRLSGELTEEQFRPHRLMNGLYLQLHSYMLRIAVPYGVLNSRQMRKLAEIARTYDRGYGHFTTRQNIQFNWPALKDTPDILAELSSVEMHAIQTSGNCIRNVTADHFAGVAHDEIADPRPYAEILRQWSSLHPEFSFLPRKFKVAVNGATHDRAVVQAHDIGLQVVRNDKGELGFRVYVGGGLGRTPMIGRMVREFLPERDLLGYVEAILRVYNLEGRRDNKFKARIKILVHEKGLEALREEVEAEFAARDPKALNLPEKELARFRAFFAPPELDLKKPVSDRVERRKAKDARFASFCSLNIVPAQDARLCRGDRLAEGDRRDPGRRERRPDGRRRGSRRGLFARRGPRLARAEPHPAPYRAGRPAGGLRSPGVGRLSRRRTPARSATSSPAPASTIARWRPRARFPSRSASPSASATASGRRRSARSRSRSPAASMPAVTITSAISAFWDSSGQGKRPTRSRSAAPLTRRPRSARSPGLASVPRMWSRRSKPSSRPIRASGSRMRRPSLTLIAASAWRRSRRRFTNEAPDRTSDERP